MAFGDTFKALADPARREMLMLLRRERLSAGELGSHFQMTGATVSYHLGVLKKADLIFETREKNYIYYALNTSVVEEAMLWLSALKGEEHREETMENHSADKPADPPAHGGGADGMGETA